MIGKICKMIGSLAICLVLASMICACQRKADAKNSHEGESQGETVTVGPIPSKDDGLSDSNLNVYVNGTRVNYLSNAISFVRPLLGANQVVKRFGYGDKGKVFDELDADGITFIYDAENGHFRDIVIESDAFFVEGGGKVGDTIKELQAKYPEGFFRTVNGEIKKDSYFYLKMIPSGDAGLGFKFFLNSENRVRKIDLGFWAFVP